MPTRNVIGLVLEEILYSSMNRLKKRFGAIALSSVLLLGLVSWTQAFQGYNVIITTAPSVESSLLTMATNQFQGVVTPNPLAANVYSINLFNLNPNYNPPTPAPSTFEEALSLGSTIYVYGFGNGMSYQQKELEGTIGAYGVACSSPTEFNLVATSTSTFSQSTCQDVISTIENIMFQLSLSTPTPLPTEP